ncbi:MAG: hypothetical protein KME59_06300 [Trichormus sp. ATA11-4-KO1]|nr:hypothetical protein [Trichormus sp. ATA11-4-KO1]
MITSVALKIQGGVVRVSVAKQYAVKPNNTNVYGQPRWARYVPQTPLATSRGTRRAQWLPNPHLN